MTGATRDLRRPQAVKTFGSCATPLKSSGSDLDLACPGAEAEAQGVDGVEVHSLKSGVHSLIFPEGQPDLYYSVAMQVLFFCEFGFMQPSTFAYHGLDSARLLSSDLPGQFRPPRLGRPAVQVSTENTRVGQESSLTGPTG